MTDQPIPLAGDGTSYRYVDTSVSRGQTYWCRIEVLPNGEFFGPVSDEGSSAYWLYLPMLNRIH